LIRDFSNIEKSTAVFSGLKYSGADSLEKKSKEAIFPLSSNYRYSGVLKD
jgi:hypothetical protein